MGITKDRIIFVSGDGVITESVSLTTRRLLDVDHFLRGNLKDENIEFIGVKKNVLFIDGIVFSRKEVEEAIKSLKD